MSLYDDIRVARLMFSRDVSLSSDNNSQRLLGQDARMVRLIIFPPPTSTVFIGFGNPAGTGTDDVIRTTDIARTYKIEDMGPILQGEIFVVSAAAGPQTVDAVEVILNET
jgi:hypothetical protein